MKVRDVVAESPELGPEQLDLIFVRHPRSLARLYRIFSVA